MLMATPFQVVHTGSTLVRTLMMKRKQCYNRFELLILDTQQRKGINEHEPPAYQARRRASLS